MGDPALEDGFTAETKIFLSFAATRSVPGP